MSIPQHTQSPAPSVPAPAHPSQGADGTNDISETRTTARSTRRGHIGLIVVGSLATGLAAALLLVLVVFAGAAEPVVTGSAMLAFGLGWAMLAAPRRADTCHVPRQPAHHDSSVPRPAHGVPIGDPRTGQSALRPGTFSCQPSPTLQWTKPKKLIERIHYGMAPGTSLPDYRQRRTALPWIGCKLPAVPEQNLPAPQTPGYGYEVSD